MGVRQETQRRQEGFDKTEKKTAYMLFKVYGIVSDFL